MAKQVQIGINDIPEGWNHNAADFINKLIQRKPENRLGHKTIQELFHHHWFDGYGIYDFYGYSTLTVEGIGNE